jgi:hypothetical protein
MTGSSKNKREYSVHLIKVRIKYMAAHYVVCIVRTSSLYILFRKGRAVYYGI